MEKIYYNVDLDESENLVTDIVIAGGRIRLSEESQKRLFDNMKKFPVRNVGKELPIIDDDDNKTFFVEYESGEVVCTNSKALNHYDLVEASPAIIKHLMIKNREELKKQREGARLKIKRENRKKLIVKIAIGTASAAVTLALLLGIFNAVKKSDLDTKIKDDIKKFFTEDSFQYDPDAYKEIVSGIEAEEAHQKAKEEAEAEERASEAVSMAEFYETLENPNWPYNAPEEETSGNKASRK